MQLIYSFLHPRLNQPVPVHVMTCFNFKENEPQWNSSAWSTE